MMSKTFLVTLMIAYVEARFGQEQVPIAAISAVQGGAAGAAATIAGATISDLLGAANACAKLARADQIVTELGGGADAIAAAKGLVAAEKNTNPFANGNAQNVCGDATLPATTELRGITPLIDPAVDTTGGVAALSQQTQGTPLDATGKSVFDLLSEAGFGDLVVSQNAAGGAAAGGAQAGNNAAAGNANQGNAAAGNANQNQGNATAGNNANQNQQGKGKNNGKQGKAKNNAKGKGKKKANAGAAAGAGNNNAAAGNQNAGNGNQMAGNNAQQGKNNAGNAGAGMANAGNNGNQMAGNNAQQGKNNAGNAGAGNANAGNANAGNNNANQNAGNNAQQGKNNAGNAGAGNANAGAAAGGAADFGACAQPTITFQGGEGNRPATEFTFQIADATARGGQGEALNPNIITNALCNNLTNFCKANAAAIAKCEDAKAQVQAAGTRDKSTADLFNTAIGFAGAVTNPAGGPANPPAAAAAGAARKMRRGMRSA